MSWRGWKLPCKYPVGFAILTSFPLGPVAVQKQASLFPDRKEEEALLDARGLIATAVITLFNVSRFGNAREVM